MERDGNRANRGPVCPDDLGPFFQEILVTDGDSVRPGFSRYRDLSGRVSRSHPPPGLFPVDLETGRRYPVFIVLVRY